MPNRRGSQIKTSLVTFGAIIFGTLGGYGQVAKEMLDRQLKVIEDTPPNEPVVLRLDEELEGLVGRAKKLPDAKQVEFLAAGLSPQGRLYATFGMSDLNGFSKLLLGKARYPHVKLGREAFAGRDLSAELRKAYAACVKAFGEALPRAPLYKVAFGYQRTTNAQTQGIDRKLGRHIVVFNRSALVPDRLWDAAIIHESWHCFQKPMPAKRTLLDWAVHEGVVTHLTQVVDPTLTDHTIMLWSEEEWAAAEKRREAIIKSFAADRATTERPMMTAYMILDKHHKNFAAAPSRCGYYVGLLAARAWAKANPDKGARDLIETDPEEIWQALAGEGT